MKRHQKFLNNCRLPPFLVEALADGTLQAQVTAAYERYHQLAALLDRWEANNPAAAALVPWREGRDEWIRNGRPDPDWWELLWAMSTPTQLICKKEIEQSLLKWNFIHVRQPRIRAKRRRKREAKERAYAKKRARYWAKKGLLPPS